MMRFLLDWGLHWGGNVTFTITAWWRRRWRGWHGYRKSGDLLVFHSRLTLAVLWPGWSGSLHLLQYQLSPFSGFPFVKCPQLDTHIVEEQSLECTLIRRLGNLPMLAAWRWRDDALAVWQGVGSEQLAVGTTVQNVQPEFTWSQLNMAGRPAAPGAVTLLHLSLPDYTAAAVFVSWTEIQKREDKRSVIFMTDLSAQYFSTPIKMSSFCKKKKKENFLPLSSEHRLYNGFYTASAAKSTFKYLVR